MIKERTPEEKLSEDTIRNSLKTLSGWKYEDDSIRKSYSCGNFRSAVQFIDRIAALAEQHDHHPDLHLTNYKCVLVVFSTHSASGVTENDIEMARLVEEVSACE